MKLHPPGLELFPAKIARVTHECDAFEWVAWIVYGVVIVSLILAAWGAVQ